MKHRQRIKRLQRKYYPVNLITKYINNTNFVNELMQAVEAKLIARYGSKAIYYNVS